MSAVVCGKRLPFDDLHGSPPLIKRQRYNGGSPPPYLSSWGGPSDSGSPRLPHSPREDPLLHLRTLFPHMDTQVVERVLESCDNNLDSAIKSLHELCLDGRDGLSLNQISASSSQDGQSASGVLAAPVQVSAPLTAVGNIGAASECHNMNGSEWVELLVREMMHATDLDDARARASRALEAFEKTIMARSGALVDDLQKEVIILKEQLQGLLRDNQILKKAVALQHERQLEHEERAKEFQQLKQLLAQYQEQVRTLELKNYSLMLHLRKAQESSSIPGHFHPDVF